MIWHSSILVCLKLGKVRFLLPLQREGRPFPIYQTWNLCSHQNRESQELCKQVSHTAPLSTRYDPQSHDWCQNHKAWRYPLRRWGCCRALRLCEALSDSDNVLWRRLSIGRGAWPRAQANTASSLRAAVDLHPKHTLIPCTNGYSSRKPQVNELYACVWWRTSSRLHSGLFRSTPLTKSSCQQS